MDTLAKLEELLHSRGQRMTVQKKELLCIFLQHSNRMLSVADLKSLLSDGIEMDNATIYRNVQNFESLGILDSMVDMLGLARYMICDSGHHHHFVCVSCGHIICFPCETSFWCSMAKQNDFEETYHRLEVYGLCAECRAKTCS